MYLFAAYASNYFVEKSLLEIKNIGINEEDIGFVEMKYEVSVPVLFDKKDCYDGHSSVNGLAAWGVIFSLCGIIYGSQVKVGPIVTGLLGLLIGAGVGCLLFLIKRKKYLKLKRPNVKDEIDILLWIRCSDDEQSRKVEAICRRHRVIYLGSIDSNPVTAGDIHEV